MSTTSPRNGSSLLDYLTAYIDYPVEPYFILDSTDEGSKILLLQLFGYFRHTVIPSNFG